MKRVLMGLQAARSFGAEVDTLTLSIEQKTLAEERVRAAGLQDRIRIHLMDYRDMPVEWAGRFDAFVSVEMLEVSISIAFHFLIELIHSLFLPQHVGTQHYETYFKLVDWALKDKNATAVVTATTFPEARYRTYQSEDFMRRYMWPNSALPCSMALMNAATKASKNRFSVQFVENHGVHYPRTLREWGRRLESNVTMDTMAKRYPGLRDPAAFESFKRKWRYLFAYAGAGFAKGYISCHMLTFYKVCMVCRELALIVEWWVLCGVLNLGFVYRMGCPPHVTDSKRGDHSTVVHSWVFLLRFTRVFRIS